MVSQKKILLVEDSSLIAGIVTKFLEGNGFKVVRAVNGVEAVQKAYTEIPDLIIMDIEMPIMKGYQASRLIKSKRGIKDIPIIMHTTLSEDKDKFWGYSSGADAYVNKDFENMGNNLLPKINDLIQHTPFDIDLIKKDAEGINQESIFEMLGNLFDEQLFQATILNQVGDVVRNIGLEETISKIFNVLNKVCEYHIVAVFIKYDKFASAFILPTEKIFESDLEEFYNICINDFCKIFPEITPDKIDRKIQNITTRSDYHRILSEKDRIKSYTFFNLLGKGDRIIGTIHIGNLSNYYFSDLIKSNISIFTKGASVILENVVFFEQIVDMGIKVKNIFSKYVPPEIIDEMLEKQKTSSLLAGEKRNVVVLFSDIRSFTTMSENNSPESIVAFLNNYFEYMVSIISKNGGTINKFIGDAILAVFGAPKSFEDNAVRAVNSAVEMIQALPKIKYRDIKFPPTGFDIGIGIDKGEVIVGNIGSKDKFDYTVIGDTVNIASRLEGLTKYYKKNIIISDAVKKEVESLFILRELDTVKVKGKEKSTKIFSVELEMENIFDNNMMEKYIQGITMYKAKEWKKAIECFKSILDRFPTDYISEIYIERCKNFLKNPPSDDWDGTTTIESK